jgi:RNA polymerase subunit RPABC4/transcription elongation factor Spt4
MKLKRDENIILDNGPLGLEKKLTLTNKRLIIQKDEGVFTTHWKKEKTISLNSIEDVYLETKTLSGLSSLKLKLKNGNNFDVSLSLSDSWMINDSPDTSIDKEKSVQMKMLNYRWVRAITNQLMKLDTEKKTIKTKIKTKFSQKCPKCEKEITQEDYEYCPFCGRSLKSKYLF